MGGTAGEGAGVTDGPYGDLMLLSGSANPELSERIAREMGMQLAEMEITRFADGEFDVKIAESVRGHDVFLIQPTCHPVSENLIQLFIILDALRRASASRITAVIPYYGYQRKEKKTQPRDPISAKLMANIIELAGANRVICVDLHAGGCESGTATTWSSCRQTPAARCGPGAWRASSTHPSPSSTNAAPATTRWR